MGKDINEIENREKIMKRISKRKKKTNKLLFIVTIVIAISFIGMMAYAIDFFGKGMFKTSPQELLIEYMNYIPKQSYEKRRTLS